MTVNVPSSPAVSDIHRNQGRCQISTRYTPSRPSCATETEHRYVLNSDGWLEEAGTTRNGIGDVAGLAPPGDIHLVRNDGATTAISLHIYGTDVSRLSSSVRRVYDLPVVARQLAATRRPTAVFSNVNTRQAPICRTLDNAKSR